MASLYKKRGKWGVWIRRSFHKPIHKTFISKQDAQRWARETERLFDEEIERMLQEKEKQKENETFQRGYEEGITSVLKVRKV